MKFTSQIPHLSVLGVLFQHPYMYADLRKNKTPRIPTFPLSWGPPHGRNYPAAHGPEWISSGHTPVCQRLTGHSCEDGDNASTLMFVTIHWFLGGVTHYCRWVRVEEVAGTHLYSFRLGTQCQAHCASPIPHPGMKPVWRFSNDDSVCAVNMSCIDGLNGKKCFSARRRGHAEHV